MKLSKKLGFTLVELLVVIGILGILAAGLLATIDPFEQLKKGRDATARNTVAELHDAVTRYNADTGSMPWEAIGSGTDVTVAFSDFSDSVVELVRLGELKEGFWDAAKRYEADIHIVGGADDVTICFPPGSKAVRGDENTHWNITGSDLGTDYDCLTEDASCYWCAM
jgi:prepilin-type N-terminal cleavage/methylation domain-containing protein